MHRPAQDVFFQLSGPSELTPQILLAMYPRGFFPWYSEGEPIRCFNPAMRCVLRPHRLRIAPRTVQYARQFRYSSAINSNFHGVIRHCATVARKGQDGTWITRELCDAFCRLSDMGYAHSFEVYRSGELCGGLYGLWIDTVFYGESMFSLSTHASLIALANLCSFAQLRGIRIIDCQIPSPHLLRHGAETLPRHTCMHLFNSIMP